MTELDFEADPKVQLITDALRAGPGSPLWRQALAAVEGGAAGDEYQLLWTARERLASGSRYREVRAGPGFARKVFERIDIEKSAGPKTPGAANLIAAASALVILGVLAVVAYFVIPRGSKPSGELSQIYFINPITANSFESQLGMEWGAFGPLQVEARNGLRPVLKNLRGDFRGGGIVWEQTVPANQPFAIEASIRVHKPSDDLAAQVFVTDDPNFSGDSATSGRELVWLTRGGEASVVLPNGRVEGQNVKLGNRPNIELRIVVARDQGAVDMNGKRIWEGANQLDPAKPRMIGIRFLARGGGDEKERASVQAIRILFPQKK